MYLDLHFCVAHNTTKLKLIFYAIVGYTISYIEIFFHFFKLINIFYFLNLSGSLELCEHEIFNLY